MYVDFPSLKPSERERYHHLQHHHHIDQRYHSFEK